MPRLILFGMCKRAITDRDDFSVSLITLLYGITTDSDEPIPPDAVIPFDWSVVTAWIKSPQDETKTFEQRIEIHTPDGTQTGEADTTFKISKRSHSNIINGNAFPVGQTGEYQVKLWLREVAEGKEWEHIADYPFEVIHAQ